MVTSHVKIFTLDITEMLKSAQLQLHRKLRTTDGSTIQFVMSFAMPALARP